MKQALLILSCCATAAMAYMARREPQISLTSILILGAIAQAIFGHWLYTTGRFDENYNKS